MNSFKHILFFLIQINGIYDILSSLCILNIIDIPVLNKLHLNLFIVHNIKNIRKNNINRKTNYYYLLFRRFLAYWIFIYGIIRICNNHLVPYSYYIESIVFLIEFKKGSVHQMKSLFVILSCLIIGIITHINM